MAQFHPKARERSEGVDDEATAVTGVVVTRLGIRPHLNRTVDADWVADPLIEPGSRSLNQQIGILPVVCWLRLVGSAD